MNENYLAQLSSPGTNETEREGETKTGSKRGAPPSPALWSGVKGWRWEEGRAGEG